MGKTTQSLNAHPDDSEFILAEGYKLTYPLVEGFDPETFFIASDPAPIKFMTPAYCTLKAKVN